MKMLFQEKTRPYLLLLLAGELLTFFPGVIERIFIISGICIISYSVLLFMLDRLGKYAYPVHKAVFGIAVGIGLMLVIRFIMTAIPVIVGAFVLFNGIERIAVSLSRKKANDKSWYAAFIFGALFILTGMYTILCAKSIMAKVTRLLGVMLIVISVYRIAGIIKASKNAPLGKDGVVEIEGYEVR